MISFSYVPSHSKDRNKVEHFQNAMNISDQIDTQPAAFQLPSAFSLIPLNNMSRNLYLKNHCSNGSFYSQRYFFDNNIQNYRCVDLQRERNSNEAQFQLWVNYFGWQCLIMEDYRALNKIIYSENGNKKEKRCKSD